MQSGLVPIHWPLQTTWRGGGVQSTQSAIWRAATPSALLGTSSLLSACPKSLDRFTLCHDSVLQHLLNAITRRKKDGLVVYADLNGWRVNGGTVPHEMALTEQKPDLVIIDKAAAPVKILLVELTVPWDSSQNFQAAVERKTARYERLIEDLREAGFDPHNMPLQIGCRGVVNLCNAANLEYICNLVGIKGIQKLKGVLG